MKPRFTPITLTTAFVLLTASLLNQAMPVTATLSRVLKPSHVQHLAHNVVPSSSQDFFEQGEKQIEEEIRHLTAPTSSVPILKINVDFPAERDRFPQVQPSDTVQPNQSQEFLGEAIAPLLDTDAP